MTKALTVIGEDAANSLGFLKLVSDGLLVGDGTPPERKSAAMVVATQMLAEGKTIAEIRQKYHVFHDRLEHRAEFVHAELERRGWDWTWEKDGEDGQEAVFSAKKHGDDRVRKVSFTMAMAKRKGIVKPGSAWEKDPAQMLRARCITRFATMWEPGIGAGLNEDREHEGDRSEVTSAIVDSEVTQIVEAAAEEKPDPGTPVELGPDTPIENVPGIPPRAVGAFQRGNGPVVLGELLTFTESSLRSYNGIGQTTADQLLTCLDSHGLKLAVEEAPSAGDGSQEAEVKDATEPAGTESDAGAGETSEEPELNSQHGQALAECRELCNSDTALRDLAISSIPELYPGKTSLLDLDSLETHVLLMRLHAQRVGLASKFEGARASVMSKTHPIDQALLNIEALRKMPTKK